MNTKNLIGFAKAAKIVGMEPQKFNYYVKERRVPGHERIAGRNFFDKYLLQGWKPNDKRKERQKKTSTKENTND